MRPATIMISACIVALALALVVGVVPVRALSPGDAWITTKVKIMLAAEGVGTSTVDIDTVAGVVTLHGSVATAEQKDAAGKRAAAIAGVQSVHNLLQILPHADAAAFGVTDEQVRQEVAENLAREPALGDSAISVKTVENGVVTLKGTARSLADQLTAVELASDVRGVRRVTSEIDGSDSLPDPALWKEPADSGARARSATRDLYTTSVIKMRLLADPETPALDINVDTRGGAVTLFGIVPSENSRAAAGQEAQEAPGVVSVKNLLQVVASSKKPAVEANDAVLTQNVKKQLGAHEDLAAIGIEVHNCVVRLTGNVATGVERLEAMQLARATTGVCSVKDDLSLQ